jgi:hypothetical protein
MKMKFFFIGIIFFMEIILFINSNREVTYRNITLQNIEAIASTESANICLGIGSVDCPDVRKKVYIIR